MFPQEIAQIFMGVLVGLSSGLLIVVGVQDRDMVAAAVGVTTLIMWFIFCLAF